MNANHSTNRGSFDDNIVEELCELVGSVCDGLATDRQRERLNELLGQSSQLRKIYLRYISLHSALITTAGSQAAQGIEEFTNQLVAEAVLPIRQRRMITSRDMLLRVAMVAFVLVSAGVYSWSRLSTPGQTPGQTAGQTATHGQLATNVEGETQPARAPQALNSPVQLAGLQVARVNHVSDNARWINANDSFAVHSIIRTGDALNLAQGEIELVYQTGVKLLLIGPAEFVFRDGGGELNRGGLMASVPEAGHGFKIETPNGTVIDLGTQFGVVVDDFGVSEVSVFEGKVEAYPSKISGSRAGKVELSQGRALQWSSEMLKPLNANVRRLPFSLASFTRAEIEDIPGVALEQTPFPVAAESSTNWQAVGQVRADGRGFLFGSHRGSSEAPYLLSGQEFDPTDGPITVVCDIRFPRLRPTDEPSFSILTRSENKRTDMERPWKDVLATCVRCNFRAEGSELDGLLETATKYERDRELTGISWGGFVRPAADTTYRLVMRDDGVNVSFSVSQRDQPSVTKTVTCRSLFRGYKNHIALEGWRAGETIVEQVRIFQHTPDENENMAGSFLNLRRPAAHLGSQDTPEQAHPLRTMVPRNARLVVTDDFSGASIDRRRWTTLGDVTPSEGSVSLGQPFVTDHIDTFHPRPYLLTRRTFTPTEGRIYILGKIEFDENFLRGYGGSFAMMTRSGKEYGVGPEWAVSALSTGVRANFWPAATQLDHMLEIHEKPTADSLDFLAGASLDIHPSARAYYFCLEDDGQAVGLTIQDANDPTIRQTLRQTTQSRLKSGYIGFESCWGSRVLLDDVGIYVQSEAAVSDE